MSATAGSITKHILVPISSEDDGYHTARAVEPYDPERVTMVFVVEKSGGAPDKISTTQAKELAGNSFAAFREVIPSAEEHIAYGTNVADAIFEAANEVDATAVAFTSRGGGRFLQFLTGDIALRLVSRNDIPVISLPRNDS